MISYQFYPEELFMLIKFSGEIDKNKFIEFMTHLLDEIKLISLRKTLVDFRDAKFNLNIDELDEIVKFRHLFSPYLIDFQAIHLVQAANETALSILFSNEIKDNHQEIYICSTVERSIELLKMNITSLSLENRLENLSNKFI